MFAGIAGLVGLLVRRRKHRQAVLMVDQTSAGLTVVVTVFAALVRMGGHVWAFQYLRDLQRAKG